MAESSSGIGTPRASTGYRRGKRRCNISGADGRARSFNPPMSVKPAMLWRMRCMRARGFILLPLTFEARVHATLRRTESRVHILWPTKGHRLWSRVGFGCPFARLMVAKVNLTSGEEPLAARLSRQWSLPVQARICRGVGENNRVVACLRDSRGSRGHGFLSAEKLRDVAVLTQMVDLGSDVRGRGSESQHLTVALMAST